MYLGQAEGVLTETETEIENTFCAQMNQLGTVMESTYSTARICPYDDQVMRLKKQMHFNSFQI